MYDTSGVWSIGLGAPNQQTLSQGEGWPSVIIALIFIANSPQVIFSTLYFAFNSLISAMTLAHEWSQYAVSYYEHDRTTYGYSPVAILSGIIVGWIDAALVDRSGASTV